MRKMTEDHKRKIGEAQRARWARKKTIIYDLDSFDFLIPMSTVLERLNERSKAGWEKDEMIVKNGIFVIYKREGIE